MVFSYGATKPLDLKSQGVLRLTIAGWSACGKTYYARKIADELNLAYLSGSKLLLQELGAQSDIDWIKDRDSIELRRTDSIEKTVDNRIIQEATNLKRVIVDAWAAPWMLRDQDFVNIWFDCNLKKRIQNAIGFPKKEGAEERFRDGLIQKDIDSQRRFKKLYGWEYGPDPDIFDFVFDVSDFMGNDEKEWRTSRAELTQLVIDTIFGIRLDG